MSSPQIHDLLVLKLVPGLGPRLTKALLDRFGSAEAVVRARPEQLADVPQIGAKLARRLYDAMRNVPVARELELVADHNVRLIAFESNEYPSLLKEIADPPHLLYLRGTLAKEDQRAIGIVGSRHCTAYGRRVAERLAAGLAHRGYTVISGLARGIDGAAHRGALAAGGRTIAVLAGGLRTIYPPEHRELACEVENHGALLSEAAMSMSPLAGMFPARNRLISGMSLAVVIVEAAEKKRRSHYCPPRRGTRACRLCHPWKHRQRRQHGHQRIDTPRRHPRSKCRRYHRRTRRRCRQYDAQDRIEAAAGPRRNRTPHLGVPGGTHPCRRDRPCFGYSSE